MIEPIVIISGQVSAGKTTAGRIIECQGFRYARISQAIRNRWDGPEDSKPPRSWYQEKGMLLHHTVGQAALCQETLDLIPDPSTSFVIDGLRWKEDVAFFRNRFEERIIHLHLTAQTKVRKARFEQREKDVSFEEADRHEVEREVPELAADADAAFDNSSNEKAALEAFILSALERRSNAC
jgi:dephospho-CoA kinase